MLGNQPLIAVVDDDSRLLESLEDLLDSAGYATCMFTSAEAFLAADTAAVDLLITDIGMPGIDGLELRARVQRTDAQLPVFVITGRHEPQDEERLERVPNLFRKPFDAAHLLAALDRALTSRNRGGHHAI
ncbi:response regulator [Sphingomonas sp. MAH-20]|uniref:Response regulator n=1 Tax=Sphingomonas horti TaxID=2682842 RepID=A0A6I4IXC8_9SPHN|nr:MULTISPECIES: response regulator [Sphingomonas]MBA2920864.1 response regulator [Sphingomonas sp. CGMCC 1.13658]MVO76850.1 response regulator [Sphingomonas horti]